MNSKTPVMVLQEYAVKHGLRAPEYALIYSVQGTHDNEFHYQVTLGIVRAVGIGRSKQIAKHDAALKALEQIQEIGFFDQKGENVKQPQPDIIASPIKTPVNAIGNLCEICVENKIPMPTFVQISEVGPPHCKEFTYECKIASIVTRATAGTKKQAKHISAKYMYDRITSVLPDLVAAYSNAPTDAPAITDGTDEAAKSAYNKYSNYSKPKPNLSLKVENYGYYMRNLLESKEVKLEEVMKIISEERSEEGLKKILEKLELEYKIETVTATCPLVALSINSEVPFCVIKPGLTEEDAISKAIDQVFEYLECLIQ